MEKEKFKMLERSNGKDVVVNPKYVTLIEEYHQSDRINTKSKIHVIGNQGYGTATFYLADTVATVKEILEI